MLYIYFIVKTTGKNICGFQIVTNPKKQCLFFSITTII